MLFLPALLLRSVLPLVYYPYLRFRSPSGTDGLSGLRGPVRIWVRRTPGTDMDIRMLHIRTTVRAFTTRVLRFVCRSCRGKPRSTSTATSPASVDNFDGTFQRLHLEPGEHDLQLFMPGHRSFSQKIYLQPGATFNVQHTMEPLGAGEAEPTRPVAPPRSRRSEPEPSARPDRPTPVDLNDHRLRVNARQRRVGLWLDRAARAARRCDGHDRWRAMARRAGSGTSRGPARRRYSHRGDSQGRLSDVHHGHHRTTAAKRLR